MLKIRLDRTGVANKPFYRIVVTDEREKLGGKSLDILGYWQPSKDEIKIDKEKLNAWVKKGAKVTPAVAKLI
jgi:small subunit ribosomal protein S16